MKKMQRNVLNITVIKQHLKQVWFYIICGATRKQIITNLQIVLSTPKKPYFNQAPPKNTCQNFPIQRNPEIENFKAPKVLWSSLSLEVRSTPLGIVCVIFGCSY